MKKIINVDKKITTKKAGWEFNKSVAKNFNSHVIKSVPFYEISHDLVEKFSDFFIKNNSNVYDIGCSTGLLAQKVYNSHKEKNINLTAIDYSKHMIDEIKVKKSKVKFINSNIETFKFKKSDFVYSLYTMQFINPAVRQKIFDKIYKSLNWGGGFVIFEKIRGADARFQEMLTFLYYDFKSNNGFNSDEILSKERSLRGKLDPYTYNENIKFLKRAGFKDIMPISQYLCFVGFLAIK
tara:strand:- start:38 stop:748 length:711 start_codon:yes stop_codon:yes gene_type:complete